MNDMVKVDVDDSVVAVESKVENSSDDSRSERSGGFIGWKSLVALLALFPSTYFIGYTYFKSYMEALGFTGAYIDGGVGEVYYQTLHAFLYVITNFLTVLDGMEVIIKVSVIYGGIASVLAFVAFMFGKNIEPYVSSWLKKVNVKKNADKSHGKFVRSILVSGGIGAVVSFGIFFALAVAIVISIMLFTVFALPAIAGENSAIEDLSGGFCKKVEWNSHKRDVLMGCNSVLLKGGKTVLGKVVFANTKYVYLVTDSKSLSIPQSDVKRIEARRYYRDKAESGGQDQTKFEG